MRVQILRPSGALYDGTQVVESVGRTLTDLLRQGHTCVIVDLIEVSVLGRQAVRVLESWARKLQGYRGDLVLACASGYVLDSVKLNTQLSPALQTFDDIDLAVAHLKDLPC